MDKSEIALTLTLKYLEKRDTDTLIGLTMKYFPEDKDPAEIPEGRTVAALFQDIYDNINLNSDKA